MSAQDNGGAAFPVTPPCDMEGASASGYPFPEGGMSLRDYFAAKAMQSLIAKGMDDPAKRNAKGVPVIATFAYEYADAMLKARQS